MFTKMLNLRRGGGYLNDLKNCSKFKIFAFWMKFICQPKIPSEMEVAQRYTLLTLSILFKRLYTA